MRNKLKCRNKLLYVFALFTPSPAHAVSRIIQPDLVTSNLGNDQSLNNLRNGSGIITPFSSQNNLADLISIEHNKENRDFWFSSSGNTTGTLTFDLGRNAFISGLALWNGGGNRGVNEFELFADTNNDFSDGGTQSLIASTANMLLFTLLNFPVQTYTFEETETRYLHLNIISNHGNANSVGLGEIAFQEVPFEFSNLPGMAFLVAVGGLAYFRNKKGGTPAG